RHLVRVVRSAHPPGEEESLMTVVESGTPIAVTVPEAGNDDLGEARPFRKDVWKRFKRNKLAMFGLVFLIVLVLWAIFAPLAAPVARYSITERSDQFRKPPSAAHWFGTDDIGRDVFSRIVYDARVSLRIGFIATAISLVIGVLLKTLAGFFSGVTDTIIARVV